MTEPGVSEDVDESMEIVEFSINAEDDTAPVEEAASDDFMLVLPGRDHEAAGLDWSEPVPDALELTPHVERTRQPGITFPRVAPATRLQGARRRWTRRLGIAALCVMGLAAIGFAAIEAQSLRTELAAPLQLPQLPAAPPPVMPAALTVPVVPDADTADAPL